MKLYALVKRILSVFVLVDNYCRQCGRRTETFIMDDELWESITDSSEPLCFRHFDQKAKLLGMWPIWIVRNNDVPRKLSHDH
jgi:hypothetical protein